MVQERRPGDWQHRSHRQANTIIRDPDLKPWYRQNFWIIIFLLVFWPVGLALMWTGDWPLGLKIGVTFLIALIVIYIITLYMPLLA